MKKNYIIAPLLATLFAAAAMGCSEGEYLLYSATNRLQLNDTLPVNYTFVFQPATLTADTVFVQVNTIGEVADHDRRVQLIQVPEYNITYKLDEHTGEKIDSTITEKPYKAKPGIHYVDFADAGLQQHYVVKAGAVSAQIPVVVLRDTSLNTNKYRLRIELAATADFELGERKARAKTIVISDMYERFAAWLQDGYSSPAWSFFGKYSTAKHQFMAQVAGEAIDQAWWEKIVAATAQTHYKNVFAEALANFNNDPANIASGAAPMREVPGDLTSALITF